MRDFTKVSPALWQSERFWSLPSDDGRFLLFYFLTSSHQNSAGAYVIPDGYASTDLHWDLSRYCDARTLLVEAGLIAFDAKASVVMVTNWFRYNPPMSDKHLLGIQRDIEKLPSEMIRNLAAHSLDETWQEVTERRALEVARKQEASAQRGTSASASRIMNTSIMSGRSRGNN